MKRNKIALGLLLAAFVVSASVSLFSCYPYGSTNPADYDVYLTLHKEDLSSYKNYKTYIMRDSVAHVSDGGITTAYDNTILSRINANMASYGYKRVYSIDSANVILSTVLTNKTTYYVDYYYGSYWGYGYGYYYPWTTVYSVTTGSVIINMVDKTTLQPGTTNPTAVWMGILNGAAGDPSTAATRITDGINKVFAQSPYLKVN